LKTLIIETFLCKYPNGLSEEGQELYLCECQGDIDLTIESFRKGYPRVVENGEVQEAIKLEFFSIKDKPMKTILVESGRA
jgi:hypothetical protein